MKYVAAARTGCYVVLSGFSELYPLFCQARGFPQMVLTAPPFHGELIRRLTCFIATTLTELSRMSVLLHSPITNIRFGFHVLIDN